MRTQTADRAETLGQFSEAGCIIFRDAIDPALIAAASDLAVDASMPENGCVRVIPGSHTGDGTSCGSATTWTAPG